MFFFFFCINKLYFGNGHHHIGNSNYSYCNHIIYWQQSNWFIIIKATQVLFIHVTLFPSASKANAYSTQRIPYYTQKWTGHTYKSICYTHMWLEPKKLSNIPGLISKHELIQWWLRYWKTRASVTSSIHMAYTTVPNKQPCRRCLYRHPMYKQNNSNKMLWRGNYAWITPPASKKKDMIQLNMWISAKPKLFCSLNATGQQHMPLPSKPSHI